MTFRISINGCPPFIATGNRDALMDAAYDQGALALTIVRLS